MFIADDHAPTRDDVRRALTDDGLIVCAEVADAARAVQQALETKPDICLLDVRMPGGGVAAAWEIAARLPTTKIVMLTVSEEDGDLFPPSVPARSAISSRTSTSAACRVPSETSPTRGPRSLRRSCRGS